MVLDRETASSVDVKHTLLTRISTNASIAKTPNNLKWSASNRLIGVNLKDRILLLEINFNFELNNEIVNNRLKFAEDLKPIQKCIKPESQQKYKNSVQNGELNDEENFLSRPKQTPRKFIHFDFAPAGSIVNVELLAALTDDFHIQIFFQSNTQWTFMVDIEEFIAASKETITSFCWSSNHQKVENHSIEYCIILGTRASHLQVYKVTLDFKKEDSEINSDNAVIELVGTFENGNEQFEIVSLWSYQDIILVESINGAISLYQLNSSCLLEFKLHLWTVQDFSTSLRVSFNSIFSPNVKERRYEVIFKKLDNICVARFSISSSDGSYRLCMPPMKFLMEGENIFGLFNCPNFPVTPPSKYLLTCFDSQQIYQIKLDTTNKKKGSDGVIRLSSTKLAIDLVVKDSSNVYFVNSIAVTSNQSIMATLVTNNSFCCGSDTTWDNVTISFYTNTSLASMSEFILSHLTNPKKPLSTNIFDYIYLFQYYLLHKSSHMNELLLSLFERTSLNNWKSNANLTCLKIVRRLLKLYYDFRFIQELHFADEGTETKLHKHLKWLEKEIVSKCLQDWNVTDSLQLKKGLSKEQLVSLYNAVHLYPRLITDTKLINQIDSLVNPSSKSNAQNIGRLVELNNCPYCDLVIDMKKVTSCTKHFVDRCGNSFLIIDHLKYETVANCAGCFRRQLIVPPIWPNPYLKPFDRNQFCLFCL